MREMCGYLRLSPAFYHYAPANQPTLKHTRMHTHTHTKPTVMKKEILIGFTVCIMLPC